MDYILPHGVVYDDLRHQLTFYRTKSIEHPMLIRLEYELEEHPEVEWKELVANALPEIPSSVIFASRIVSEIREQD